MSNLAGLVVDGDKADATFLQEVAVDGKAAGGAVHVAGHHDGTLPGGAANCIKEVLLLGFIGSTSYNQAGKIPVACYSTSLAVGSLGENPFDGLLWTGGHQSDRQLGCIVLGAETGEGCGELGCFLTGKNAAIVEAELDSVVANGIVAGGNIDKAIQLAGVGHDFRCGGDEKVLHGNAPSCQNPGNNVPNFGAGGAGIKPKGNPTAWSTTLDNVVCKNLGNEGRKNTVGSTNFFCRVFFITRDSKNFSPARSRENH